MRAYSELYLEDAMHNLAGMFDYAIRGLNYDCDEFFNLFIQTKVAQKFEHGNPKYVAGLSGIELCQNVVEKAGQTFTLVETDKSFDGCEYWTGWVLAYFQWFSAFRFSDLQEYGLIPSEIQKRYILHEADISKFVDCAYSILKSNISSKPTRLQKIRKLRNMTQKELSELSGVNLRMIQLYEQRQSDINKAAASVINKLSWILKCNFYDILELEI